MGDVQWLPLVNVVSFSKAVVERPPLSLGSGHRKGLFECLCRGFMSSCMVGCCRWCIYTDRPFVSIVIINILIVPTENLSILFICSTLSCRMVTFTGGWL